MIKLIKSFYRANFLPLAKAQVLRIFEQEKDLQRVAMLCEFAPLSGTRRDYVWKEFLEDCRLLIREVNHIEGTDSVVVNRECSKQIFNAVFSELEDCRKTVNTKLPGKARDGISYSMCWGNPCQLNLMNLDNPQLGPKHHMDLVSALKEYSRTC